MMDKPSFKLVGSPCGHHGQYTFYKALRVSTSWERIIAIGDFFFVRLWQDSELVSIGELQLLWTDRASDQTLVSLRLYFLPENTPDGRGQHGQDEVLAISDKVVVRAEDLLSWLCEGAGWRWGLRAVWRESCAPSSKTRDSAPLHHTKLDFTDIEREKSTITGDAECPGVVVFSYPRYCRYRALLARLEGIEADWLRDSLVAALGGYAAPTKNTRILYCKDTFEYPELEGHEFVCNHLAPKLKGRPRGRRKKRVRSRELSKSPSTDRSSDSDRRDYREPELEGVTLVQTSRRISLRNGTEKQSEEEIERDVEKKGDKEQSAEDKAFLEQLQDFYRKRNENVKIMQSINDVSLRSIYQEVSSNGGYEAMCRLKLWRVLFTSQPARVRRHYERFLLPFEIRERRNNFMSRRKLSNGKIENVPQTIDCIDITEQTTPKTDTKDVEYRLKSPKKIETMDVTEKLGMKIEKSDITKKLDIIKEEPKIITEKTEVNEKFEIKVDNTDTKIEKSEMLNETNAEEEKDEMILTSKPAEELNREFLESLPPKEEIPLKITVKPVDKLIELNSVTRITSYLENNDVVKLFQENSVLITELVAKHNLMDSKKVIDEIETKQLSDRTNLFLSELAQKLNLGNPTFLPEMVKPQPETVGNTALSNLSSMSDKYAINGHTPVSAEQRSYRPAGRSSLRAVRVKPTRPTSTAQTPPVPSLRPDSASPSPQPTTTTAPITNFGIHHPPLVTSSSHSDDEIVEVPYQPKTPEIIDLDEYPESPQAVKKKKLEILKEGGLEVTPIPRPPWPHTLPPQIIPAPLTPLITPTPMMLSALQPQIMNPAQLYQLYNIVPNYSNGVPPPKVMQGTSIFGSSGPEKTVYGNPKDPFMPPPHVLHGTPMKSQRNIQTPSTPSQDILDLTRRNETPGQKPAVEIVKLPSVPSPTKNNPVQNSPKNYTIIDGKAVVGSNLEITLVNPRVTPTKPRPPQKRSSNGKFMSTKNLTPPKDYPKPYASPSPSGTPKKPPIVVPNYQISRDNVSPTSSTSSRDSQTNLMQNNLYNVYKSQNNLTHLMDMQKSSVANMSPFMDPYMSALYSSLGQMDQRQLALYREFMANQVRGYSGLLNLGVASTPTTKN